MSFNDDNVVHMESTPEEEWKRCEVIDDMGLHLKQPNGKGHKKSTGAYKLPLASAYVATGALLLGILPWLFT